MLASTRQLHTLVCSCLAGLFLAGRGEESVARSVAQRYEAMQQKLERLQDKQESIVQRLEAEAQRARLEKESGRMDKEVQSAREALAEQVNNHINALKAELRFLQVPGLDYSNFKAAAEMIKHRSSAIGEAIDRMTPTIPEMIEKSQKYQHDNYDLLEGYKEFQNSALWHTQHAIRHDKEKELHDIDAANWERAFTDQDREAIKKATKAQMDLINKGKFSLNTDEMDFGEDPYADMYSDGVKPGVLTKDQVKMWKDWMKEKETKPLPTNPSIKEDVEKQEQDERGHAAGRIVIDIPDAPQDLDSEHLSASSLVQVLPKGLRVRHNSSNASK